MELFNRLNIDILSESIVCKWCYVNTDNEFTFMGEVFLIDKDVEDYKVHKKAGEIEDYTNESSMEEVLVALDGNYNLRFFNQSYKEIDKEKINIRKQNKRGV